MREPHPPHGNDAPLAVPHSLPLEHRKLDLSIPGAAGARRPPGKGAGADRIGEGGPDAPLRLAWGVRRGVRLWPGLGVWLGFWCCGQGLLAPAAAVVRKELAGAPEVYALGGLRGRVGGKQYKILARYEAVLKKLRVYHDDVRKAIEIKGSRSCDGVRKRQPKVKDRERVSARREVRQEEGRQGPTLTLASPSGASLTALTIRGRTWPNCRIISGAQGFSLSEGCSLLRQSRSG